MHPTNVKRNQISHVEWPTRIHGIRNLVKGDQGALMVIWIWPSSSKRVAGEPSAIQPSSQPITTMKSWSFCCSSCSVARARLISPGQAAITASMRSSGTAAITRWSSLENWRISSRFSMVGERFSRATMIESNPLCTPCYGSRTRKPITRFATAVANSDPWIWTRIASRCLGPWRRRRWSRAILCWAV